MYCPTFLVRRVFIFLCCAFFLLTQTNAEHIKEIKSIEEARIELESANEKVLVVFDIDKTLLVSDVPVFELDQKVRFMPVEAETVEIIHNLQERGVPVIALTHSGSAPEIRRWRAANLEEIGINFRSAFPLKECEFNEFPQLFGSYPAFYNGILCTGGVSKGALLAAFIKRLNLSVDKVIFFDDQFLVCLDVHLAMAQLGIPVQCYWYRGTLCRDCWADENVQPVDA